MPNLILFNLHVKVLFVSCAYILWHLDNELKQIF